MNTKEYTERYYMKKAIQYLNEKGVEINANSIKRAIAYLQGKSNMKKYQKYRAATIDSSFMKFANDYENELYCSANVF